jgi:hypothetical protein
MHFRDDVPILTAKLKLVLILSERSSTWYNTCVWYCYMSPEMHFRVKVRVACSNVDKAPRWGWYQTERILKFVVDSFRLDAVLLKAVFYILVMRYGSSFADNYRVAPCYRVGGGGHTPLVACISEIRWRRVIGLHYITHRFWSHVIMINRLISSIGITRVGGVSVAQYSGWLQVRTKLIPFFYSNFKQAFVNCDVCRVIVYFK